MVQWLKTPDLSTEEGGTIAADRSFLYANILPKGDETLEGLCFLFRLRIRPSCIRERFVSYDNVVVVGFALPPSG